ncbi:MAG: T9SS type A sorting domain-containing protein [Ignavibacterium sp.]|nr:T9SS type A sorting domain-containing protein [Ignavibacterium sp.]
MPYKKYLVLLQIAFFALAVELIAQPNLKISPNQVRFEDLFNRIDSTYLINEGNSILSIDSVNYNPSFYSITFENNLQLPFNIQPNDTVKMHVYLNGFYYITYSDTSDTIFVFNNGINSPEPLKVKIDFYEDDFGIAAGTVRDSITPLDSTTIYFFYNGMFLIDKAVTDASGYYEITLPEGEYIIAAERDGYRVIFKDSTYDPYFAKLVGVEDDDTTVIDFYMKKTDDLTKSVSGQILDSLGGTTLDKGVIIVRKGTHVPSQRPLEGSMFQEPTNVFAGFIKPDGNYNVYVSDEDYYFVQAYSDYFLPGYYNDAGNASVFWQNADSILINTNLTDKNLLLQKDIAYGAGAAAGNLALPAYDAYGYDGITLLARSVSTGSLYSYNFGKDDATFRVNHLPYGTYELIAQKFGLPNAVSQQFTIDSLNTSVAGLTITFSLTDIDDNPVQPFDFILYQNYPNPFNSSTIIRFVIPIPTSRERNHKDFSSQASRNDNPLITLKIYDILGNELTTLVDSYLPAGKYEVTFDASAFASGIYFYKLQSAGFTQVKKLVLIK